jgi:hypothetical protein
MLPPHGHDDLPTLRRRTLALALVLVIALQGFAAVQARVHGPLHRHAEVETAWIATAIDWLVHAAAHAREHAHLDRHALARTTPHATHAHHHGAAERHHHAPGDPDPIPLGDDGAAEAGATALAAALALLAFGRPGANAPRDARHVWRSGAPWALHEADPRLQQRPPRAAA